MSSHFFPLASPPLDVISALQFSTAPDSTRLLVASWDHHVYLYDIRDDTGRINLSGDGQGSGKLLAKYQHPAGVLDACFGKDENEIFTAGLDWVVRRIDVQSGDHSILSSHTAGVKSVVYSRPHGLIISASWDSTLHVHNEANPQSYITITLPVKPFAISLSPTKLVTAMSTRVLHIHELSNLLKALESASQSPHQSPNPSLLEPWQERESGLRYMFRSVACMPNDAGYATSSIEGRVAVEWFDPSPESQERKYAFKCHRVTEENENGPVEVVYPVHTLTFHPVFGTFASGGGDGVVALWDAVAKRRVRQYQRFSHGVPALGFSSDGQYLAVATSPGVEQEAEGGVAVEEGAVKIYVRKLNETEAKGKGAK